MIIILAVLALIVVKALAESLVGCLHRLPTVPIALFMASTCASSASGTRRRSSVIGIVLLVASIYFGGVSAHDRTQPGADL